MSGTGTPWRALAWALVLPTACGGADDERAAPRRGAEDRAVPARLEVPQDAPLVVFLGDSLAAALHLPAEDAFPAVLQRRLVRAGRPFRLVNAGVSGDTTRGGLSRLDWLLRQKPAIVVVELGANDGLRGVPLETIEENLRRIVERCREAGVRVLLLGMRLPPNYGSAYAEGFAAVYPRIAQETGVALVPFLLEGVAGRRELNLADGIHPTAEGHRRLADNVEEALVDLLGEALGG